MFKPKTPISAVFASPKGGIERDGRLENSSGGWIRTNDLRVMSSNLISLTLDLQAIHIGYTC